MSVCPNEISKTCPHEAEHRFCYCCIVGRLLRCFGHRQLDAALLGQTRCCPRAASHILWLDSLLQAASLLYDFAYLWGNQDTMQLLLFCRCCIGYCFTSDAITDALLCPYYPTIAAIPAVTIVSAAPSTVAALSFSVIAETVSAALAAAAPAYAAATTPAPLHRHTS